MQAVLGTLLLYVLLAMPPQDPAWLAFLAGAGAASLWTGWRQWQATEAALELTESELRSTTGEILARIDEIEALDRGLFAFRPSNGFVLKLSSRRPRRWAPGLWWRLGRRVGVGGVTGAAQTRAFAELLTVLLARRAAGPDSPTG
jgi:hypothetical protein